MCFYPGHDIKCILVIFEALDAATNMTKKKSTKILWFGEVLSKLLLFNPLLA